MTAARRSMRATVARVRVRLRISRSVAHGLRRCPILGLKMVNVNRRRTRNVIRIPVEQIAVVAELKERIGPRAAAQQLGFSRVALLGIIANGEAAPGTASLLREALARRGRQA